MRALRTIVVTAVMVLAPLPAPAKLTPAQAVELKKYDAWLHAASARVLAIATSWEQKVDQLRAGCEKDALCNKAASAKAIAEMNMSFNAGYLNLQEQMHAVKNSISNVR